jgi:hypothetical protein
LGHPSWWVYRFYAVKLGDVAVAKSKSIAMRNALVEDSVDQGICLIAANGTRKPFSGRSQNLPQRHWLNVGKLF